jgi:hypothetical protein
VSYPSRKGPEACIAGGPTLNTIFSASVPDDQKGHKWGRASYLERGIPPELVSISANQTGDGNDGIQPRRLSVYLVLSLSRRNILICFMSALTAGMNDR